MSHLLVANVSVFLLIINESLCLLYYATKTTVCVQLGKSQDMDVDPRLLLHLLLKQEGPVQSEALSYHS